MFEPVNVTDQLDERFKSAKLLEDAVNVVLDAKKLGELDWAHNAYLVLRAENAVDPVEWKTKLIETCK